MHVYSDMSTIIKYGCPCISLSVYQWDIHV